MRYEVGSVRTFDPATLDRVGVQLFKQDGGAGRLVMISAEGWDGSAYQSSVVVDRDAARPARGLTPEQRRLPGRWHPSWRPSRHCRRRATPTSRSWSPCRSDGRPQLSNVLHYVGEDGVVRVSTTADRAKYANLRRQPWAALHVDGSSFWSYAVLECDVTLSAGLRRPRRRHGAGAGRLLPRRSVGSTTTGTTTEPRW